jgi:hypothetical protein
MGDGEYWMGATGRSPVQLIWSSAWMGKKGELHMVGFAHATGPKSQVPDTKSQTNSKYESQNTQMDGGF